MEDYPSRIAKLEQRIEKLETQVSRLIDSQHPYPPLSLPIRRAAMFAGLSSDEEHFIRKLLPLVRSFNNGEEADVTAGLWPFPDATVELFNSYADKQELGVEEVQALFDTYIQHHPCLASQMLEAWNEIWTEIERRSNKADQ